MLRCQGYSVWVNLCFRLKIDKWSLKIVERKIFLWFINVSGQDGTKQDGNCQQYESRLTYDQSQVSK